MTTTRPTLSKQDFDRLQNLEEAMWQAESRFDPVFQEKYFAGDFFEFGRSGKIWNRPDSILLHPQVIDCVLPLPHFQARLLAPGVVQITYDSIVRLGNETQYAHRSSIWSQENGDWVMRFHLGTPFTIEN